MITIDGKPLDLTNPDTWGDKVTIKPDGYIETESVKWAYPVGHDSNDRKADVRMVLKKGCRWLLP